MNDAPKLHGRDTPMRALRGALDAALAGRGRIALVSGEAGIGKSAIAAAIARDAEARGALVTWGRAWEFADAPPYFPLLPGLRALSVDLSADAGANRGERDAFLLWERVLEALARTSASTPAVWILEDMHAADLGSLDLLTFLAQPLRALRVLVVATVRTNDPHVTARMTQRLTRMARDGLDVRLEPLTAGDVAALTAETLGRAVPESAAIRLVELTGGNPLFVVECARDFRAAGGLEGTLGSLPPTVRQIVLERVEALPQTTRDSLAAGAVLGRDFSAASVARMSESLPARVIDDLLPALRAGLLRETKPGQFIFSHALTRDAIDHALGAEQRADLHARADAALAPLGDSAEILVERARHALAALRSGDEGRALDLVQRATALLEREGALDRAFDLFVRIDEARAAGLLPRASGEEKLHVARIARDAGRSDAARALCAEVTALARAAGDAELFARAALLHASDVRPGVIDRPQLALLEEARTMLGDASPKLACVVLARHATALQPAPDPSVPARMTQEALRLARETGDDAVIREVLALTGWGLYYAPLAEKAALATELLERAVKAEDLENAVHASVSVAMYHVLAGDFVAFEEDVRRSMSLAEEVGHPRRRWQALLVASADAVASGRFAESDRFVTEVEKLAPLIDESALELSLTLHQVFRSLSMRRDSDVRTALSRLPDASRGMATSAVFCAVMRAVCAARMDDVDAVRAELAALSARDLAMAEQFGSSFHLAEVYAASGSDEDRRRLRARLVENGALEASGAQFWFTYDGPIVRILGLVDAALGDLPLAEKELREALSLAVERRHPPLEAQIVYELAKVLRKIGGREEEGAALVERCSEIARRLGMTGLAGNVEATVLEADRVVELAREGDVWRVRRGKTLVRVKHSRGLELLARLVERPGEEVHVLALGSDEPAANVVESDAGEVLDERARKAYRQRIVDLDEDLADAERCSDVGRIEKLRRERIALDAELKRAVGLGGRSRRDGSATERARVNVQRRMKDAIARIGEVDADLGRFFERAVSTGTFCCFRP